MKLLHCADLHFQNDAPLLEDIVKCTNFLAETAKKEKPNLIVIAGDIFDEVLPLDSPAAMAAVAFVAQVGDIAPTLIVRGTPGHDHESLHVFRKIRAKYEVRVADFIEQVELTASGFRDYSTMSADTMAVISCVPSVTKGHILAVKDLTINEANVRAADLLRDVFAGFGVVNRELEKAGIPTILAGHGSLTGSTLSTGQQLVGKDLEFDAGDLALTDVDLVCLGHIHKAQEHKNIYYSGSITRLNFGETEDKGFWIHTLAKGKVGSRFVVTPARQMLTLDIASMDDVRLLQDSKDLDAANVRVRYEISEEAMHTMKDLDIEKILKEKGASSVVVRKTVIPTQRQRAAGISRMRTLQEKVKKWGEASGVDITEEMMEKMTQLEEKDVDTIMALYDSPGAHDKVAQTHAEEKEQCDLFA